MEITLSGDVVGELPNDVQQAIYDFVLAGLREWHKGIGGDRGLYDVVQIGDWDVRIGVMYVSRVGPDGVPKSVASFWMTDSSVVVVNSGDMSLGGHLSYDYCDVPLDKLVPYMLMGLPRS